MDGEDKIPWSGPSIEHREGFLQGMQRLTDRISESPPEEEPTVAVEEPSLAGHPDELKLEALIQQGNTQAAFFLARRLVAGGEGWVVPWLERIQATME